MNNLAYMEGYLHKDASLAPGRFPTDTVMGAVSTFKNKYLKNPSIEAAV